MQGHRPDASQNYVLCYFRSKSAVQICIQTYPEAYSESVGIYMVTRRTRGNGGAAASQTLVIDAVL